MRELFELPEGFPSDKDLRRETLKALIENNRELSTKEIKDYIVNKLKLSQDVLNFENSDGLTLLIDYRLRWARTALKNSGEIRNVKKGFWEAVNVEERKD